MRRNARGPLTAHDYFEAGADAKRLADVVDGLADDIEKIMLKVDRVGGRNELLLDNLMKVLGRTVQAKMDLENVSDGLSFLSRRFDGIEEASFRTARSESLYKATIRLAHANPELRPILLPVLKAHQTEETAP